VKLSLPLFPASSLPYVCGRIHGRLEAIQIFSNLSYDSNLTELRVTSSLDKRQIRNKSREHSNLPSSSLIRCKTPKPNERRENWQYTIQLDYEDYRKRNPASRKTGIGERRDENEVPGPTASGWIAATTSGSRDFSPRN